MANDVINGELIEDINGKWLWRTADGRQIAVEQMDNNHLRNAAMFLMGMGYAKCIASDEARVVWLRILRIEWERRMLLREQERKVGIQDAVKQLEGLGWKVGKRITSEADLQKLIEGE